MERVGVMAVSMYIGTRNSDLTATASEAILRGICPDGGLYIPKEIPKMDCTPEALLDMDYQELAYQVLKLYLDFTEQELRDCIAGAYSTKFDTKEIVPLVKKGDAWYLELFHGKTLAFKDMALSILPYLMKTAAKRQGLEQKIVILTATSGDTGKAALEGFADVEGIDIMVFFPENGVSPVQKLQMTTQQGKNVFVAGIEGNFDDAQSAVKSIFTDKALAQELAEKGYCFSSANSINIGRLVPQMLVLFIFLAFLEGCGYMARIAFIMDRIFRKFGLSGKSFIPMLIGTGCGVPGVMASRTIENDRDRKMTVMTTTFIPCGAKLPIIALIAGALFGGASWVAPSAYFVGIVAIVTSGIILKKTKMFAGDPAPFVMELPAYHMPTVGSVLRSMWERGSSFIKKAGTVILISAILLWFLQSFGITDAGFGMVDDLNDSILANLGSAIAWIFAPLGWGQWQSAVAAITGLIAKENVVATFGVLFGFAEVAEDGMEYWGTLSSFFTPAAAYSFLVFNLLCAPCFAAIGAIKREMNNAKWTWFAIGYQTIFAYLVSLCVYQIGSIITGAASFGIGTVVACIVIIGFIYLLFRPYKESKVLTTKVTA